MSEGAYKADNFYENGALYSEQTSREVTQEVCEAYYHSLNEYLARMQKDGWKIEKMDQPQIIVAPKNALKLWEWEARTFILWQRTPLAEAIYGI